MPTKKEMTKTVKDLFKSCITTKDAQKYFLSVYNNQESFFKESWDQCATDVANKIIKNWKLLEKIKNKKK